MAEIRFNSSFFKKHWLHLLLVAVVLWLLYLLLQGREREVAAIARAAEADRRVQAIERERRADSIKFANDVEKATAIIRYYDSSYNAQMAANQSQRKTVREAISKINRLMDSAKISTDTTQYAMRIDSAAREMDQLVIKYAGLEYSMDELIRLQSSKDSANAAMIETLKAQVASVTKAYLEILDKYNILYKDFGKIAKKAKNRQLLNKILAGAVLATGGALIIK